MKPIKILLLLVIILCFMQKAYTDNCTESGLPVIINVTEPCYLNDTQICYPSNLPKGYTLCDITVPTVIDTKRYRCDTLEITRTEVNKTHDIIINNSRVIGYRDKIVYVNVTKDVCINKQPEIRIQRITSPPKIEYKERIVYKTPLYIWIVLILSWVVILVLFTFINRNNY
jgi:hypothetical protein